MRKIILCVLCIVFVICITFLMLKFKNSDSNFSSKSSIQNIINNEEETLQYLKKHPKSKKGDEKFKKFYSDLLNFNENFINDSGIADINTYDGQQENITLKGTDLKLDKNSFDSYSIVKPKTDLIKIQINAEFISSAINNKYLYKEFSNYLGEAWKQYLYLSQKNEEEIFADGSGVYVTKEELAQWIISWRTFLLQYPDFSPEYKETIEKEIKYYSSEFIFDFNNFGVDSKIITADSKKAYEKFLKEANRNTEEYKVINNCYTVLKNNGFKESIQFHKYLYDWIKDEPWGEEKKVYYRNLK